MTERLDEWESGGGAEGRTEGFTYSASKDFLFPRPLSSYTTCRNKSCDITKTNRLSDDDTRDLGCK